MSTDSQLAKDFRGARPGWDDVPEENILAILNSPGMSDRTSTTSPDLNILQEMSDYWIDENSADWQKAAYNNSLTGMAEQMITGSARYDLTDYTPGFWEDIFSTALGFLMPLDLLAMWAGGKIGGALAKPLAASMQTKAATKIGGTALKGNTLEGLSMAQKMLVGGVRQAPALGLYEGAIGGVQARIEGKDTKGTLLAIGDGILHGSMMGFLTGGVGAGMGAKNAEILGRNLKKVAGKKARPLTNAEQFYANVLTGVPGQVVAEASVFSAASYKEHGILGKVLAGKELQSDEIFKDWIKNIGLFSVLKTQSKLIEKTTEAFSHYEKEYLADVDKASRKERESMDNVKDNVNEQGAGERGTQNVVNEVFEGNTRSKNKYNSHVEEISALKEALNVFKNIINRGEGKDINPQVARDYINVANVLPDMLRKLIKNKKVSSKDRYIVEGQIEKVEKLKIEWEAVQKELEVLKKEGIQKAWSKEQIIAENLTLGTINPRTKKHTKVFDFKKEGIDISTKEGRKEAQVLLLEEARRQAVEKRRKDTGAEDKIGEHVEGQIIKDSLAEQSLSKKKDKEVVSKLKNPKQKKDLNERYEKSESLDKTIESDVANKGKNSLEGTNDVIQKRRGLYEQSKQLVRHFVQNILPQKMGGTVRKGAYIKDYLTRGKQLNEFAKWLAGRDKTFETMEAVDYQLYLSENPSHVTSLNMLFEHVTAHKLSPKLIITKDIISGYAKAGKYQGEAVEGLRTSKESHNINKEGITYTQPKTNVTITKWISGTTKKLLANISKVKKTVSDIMFQDVNSNPIGNSLLNKFVGKIFGDKQFVDPSSKTEAVMNNARLFRRSFITWVRNRKGKAGEDYNALSAVELVKEFVLGDKSNQDVISKSYVAGKEGRKAEAVKLLKEYIKEIEAGGKGKEKGDGYYTTKEIADGLKKINKNKKTITIDGVKIDITTAKGLARFMIEANPRLNEIVPSSQTKYQKENVGVRREPTEQEVFVSQKEYFKRVFPQLTIKLKETLGDYQGERILGKITGHVIRINKGLAKNDTMPHEVSHHVVDVLKEFGGKTSKNLINEGINLFGKNVKRKKGESLVDFNNRKEEAFVQALGEWAAGKMQNQGMAAKAKMWTQKFWSHVKVMFGTHTDKDILRIIGGKVLTGRIPKGQEVFNFVERLETNYQSRGRTIKTITKEIHRKEDQMVADNMLSRKIMNEIRENIFGEKAFFHKGKGYITFEVKKNSKNRVTYKELEMYYEALNERAAGPKALQNRVKEINEEYNITDYIQKKILESLEIEGGELANISAERTKDFMPHYEMLAKSHGESRIKRVHVMQKIADTDKSIPVPLLRGVMPVLHVLKHYMGKSGRDLYNKAVKFDLTMTREYKGEGDIAVHQIKRLLNAGVFKLGGTKHVWLWDTERATKGVVEKDGKTRKLELTKDEQKFLDSSNDGTIIFEHVKTGKQIVLEGVKGNNQKSKYMNNDMYIQKEVKGTSEFRAKHIHDTLMNWYWKSLHKEVQRGNNSVEMKKFEKEFSEKMINQYMTRRLTSEAYDYIVTDKKGERLEKLAETMTKEVIRDQASDIAFKKTGKRSGPEYNKVYKEQFEKIQKREKKLIKSDTGTSILSQVQTDIVHMLRHNHHKIKNRHLLKRGPLLPEFMEIVKDGKVKQIRTYETSLERTINPYINSMSKYLATVKHFPELTPYGSKYGITKERYNEWLELIGDNENARYSRQALEAIIGMDMKTKNTSREATDVLRHVASGSALLGLSSPLSGIKNLLIGTPRTAASFGLWNTVKAIPRILSPEVWEQARAKGILEYGSKTRGFGEMGKGMFTMEKAFEVNLMTFTENVNRIISMEAGRMYFNEAVSQLKGEGGLFGQWSEGRTKQLMSEMWRLNKKEVKWLQEADLSKPENMKQLQNILGLVEHYSHIATQGGTTPGQLPLWANNPMVKPFTLFQRMAYSTTWDSYRNYWIPMVKHGNIAPFTRAVVGHMATGAVLYSIYDGLFDVEPPKSAGTQLDKALMYLWRSEFLGVYGEVLSPFDSGFARPLMEPVIWRNGKNAYKHFNAWYTRSATMREAASEMVLDTFVLAGQIDRWGKARNPYWAANKKLDSWERQYREQMGIIMPDGEVISRRRPYYKRLKMAIMEGDQETVAKRYWEAYAFLIHELEQHDTGSTPWGRHKDAIRALDSSVSSMDPINFSHQTKRRVISKRKAYLNWLRKNIGVDAYQLAIKTEEEFISKRMKMIKIIKLSPTYRDKYSTYSKFNF